MPLLDKYQKIKDAMVEEYGPKKGEEVFYAWCNEHGVNPDAKTVFDLDSPALTFNTDQLALQQIETKEGKRYYVTGYISTPDLDSQNDIVTKECLADMVRQIQEGNIKLDVNHESVTKDTSMIPIGRIIEGKLDNRGVWIKAELNSDSSKFREVWGSIKNGFLDAFSITFLPLQFVKREVKGVQARLLYAVKLLNVAITGLPAQEKATMTGAFMKSLTLTQSKSTGDKMVDKEKDLPEKDKEEEEKKKACKSEGESDAEKVEEGKKSDKDKEDEEEIEKKKGKKSSVPSVAVVEKSDLKSISEVVAGMKAQIDGMQKTIADILSIKTQVSELVGIKSAIDSRDAGLKAQLDAIEAKMKAPVFKAELSEAGDVPAAKLTKKQVSIIGML